MIFSVFCCANALSGKRNVVPIPANAPAPATLTKSLREIPRSFFFAIAVFLLGIALDCIPGRGYESIVPEPRFSADQGLARAFSFACNIDMLSALLKG